MNFDVDSRLIYLTKHGSHAYGTNIATSDLDIKGVCVPPREYIHGYAFRFEQQEQLVSKGHPHDKVVYGLHKFFALAAECNPNIIEVLHTDPSDHLFVSPVGEKLLQHKDLFLSKRAGYSFAGYANAQLKRIRTHRNWLLTPPTKKPTRPEFGLPDEDSKVINSSALGAVNALQEDGYEFSGSVMAAIQKEKQYAAALQQWKQYLNWKETRNKDRAELEAKFGFDSKHGMHLIRLMRMCVDILEGKGVIVKRPDAQELLAIRAGAWTYDQLLEEANKLEVKVTSLLTTTSLPSSAPVHKLNDLCVELTETVLRHES